MNRRSTVLVALGVVSVVAVSGCGAGSSSAAGAKPWAAATVAVAPADLPDEPAAVALLRAAAAAAAATSFEAVAVSKDPRGTATKVRVVHHPQVGTVIADPTFTRAQGRLYPEEAAQPTVAGSLRFLDLLVERFAVVLGAEGTALGRTADVVEARDAAGVVEARFWVDRTTGLMVRRDVTRGGVTRTSEFTTLRVPASDQVGQVVATASAGPTLDSVAISRIRSEGWPCPEGLPGGLSLAQAQESEGGAIHLVYSDGIEVVSLFVQPGRASADMEGMRRREIAGGPVLEATSGDPAWVWSMGGSVLTLMTDAPAESAERIIAALPPDPAQ